MTIALMALQFLTAKMLRGQTLAGEVEVSPIDPMREDLQRVARGILSATIGDDERTTAGRDLTSTDRQSELVVQAVLPESIRIEFDGSPITLEGRGAGGEVAMAMLGRQVERVMMAGTSEAAQCWRELVVRIVSVKSTAYLFEVEKGFRLVARETVYSLDTIDDPGYGDDELSPLWDRICTLLEGDDDYAPIGAWIRSELTTPTPLPHGSRVQADQGLTEAGARATGETAFLDHPVAGDEAALLYQITLDPNAMVETAPDEDP